MGFGVPKWQKFERFKADSVISLVPPSGIESDQQHHRYIQVIEPEPGLSVGRLRVLRETGARSRSSAIQMYFRVSAGIS